MIKIFAKGVHYHETFLLYPSDLETVERTLCQGRFRLNIRFFFSLEEWLDIQTSCLGGGVTMFENVQQESGCGTWGMV